MQARRIAVVEDEASIAASVAARLRAEGFEVEVAGDGHAGVELCRSFRPDLVVLDLMLPGIDGLEVCRLVQRERHVPVLMLTARDSEVDLEVGLGVGADDYMTKPFSPRELVARVRARRDDPDRGTDTEWVPNDRGAARVRSFALAAALVATAFLPGERLGVAVPAVAALMLLAAGAGLRVSPLRLAFGLLAFALATQAAVLDAGWVVSLDLLAAWVLASLAAAGPALARSPHRCAG